MEDYRISKIFPEILCLIIAIGSIFLHDQLILVISLAIVCLQFKRLDYNSNLFLMLTFLSTFVSTIFYCWNIQHIGGIMHVIAFALFYSGYKTGKTRLYHFRNSGLQMTILLLLFSISFAITTGGDFAATKLSNTCYIGFINLLGFQVLFSNFNSCSRLLGLYYIIYAFLLIGVGIQVNGIDGPSNLLDFGFFRYQTISMFGTDEDGDFHIDYQFIGYYYLMGIAIIMAMGSIYKNLKKNLLFVLAVGGIICVLYTGARQTIVAMLVLVCIYLLLEYKSKSLIYFALLTYFIMYIFQTNEGFFELFASTAEEGYVEGGGRGPWLLRGIALFIENPLIGVGFGRFSFLGRYDYPHNLFIELLSEVGLVGTIVVLFISFAHVSAYKQTWKYSIYILAVFFLRSMASGDMRTSITVFAILFSSPALNYIQTQIKE